MSTTYENVAYDRVLKGVETILETEFTNEVIVYLSEEYEDYPKRKSIRLWNLPSEQIARMAGAVTDLYPVDITCYVPLGQRSKRVLNDESAELANKVKRVLVNNCSYAPSSVYKWHTSSVDVDPRPDREEGEPEPDAMLMSKILFSPIVTELI